MAMRSSVRNLTWSSDRRVALAFLALAGVPLLYRYVLISAGQEAGVSELWFDARTYWYPIARELDNGAILYVSTTPDNKTPLWFGLNYLVYRTGYYIPVFYGLTALVNALSAILLWRWVDRDVGESPAGILAGGLFLTVLPIVNGDIINVRSYAMLMFVAALLVDRAEARGGLAAASVLFSQQLAFGVPVLLYREYRRSERWTEKPLRFLLVGGITGVAPFLALAVIVSPESAVAGVRMSVLGAPDYIVNHPDHGNPFYSPYWWARNTATRTFKLYPVVVAGGVSMAYWVWNRGYREWNVLTIAALLTLSFGATILLRTLAYYWIPPLAFLAVMIGVVAFRVLERRIRSGL